MKKQIFKKIFVLALILATFTVGVIVYASATNKVSAEEHVYYADFEGMVVNENSTVDNNTGFIWANNWKAAKTVRRNNSTMLEMPLYDSSEYTTVGGFGISAKSNLARCVAGEPYDVETYFEMVNVDYAFVEFVGGDGNWGCVIIYSDGRVMERTGGSNMSNVSYINNILKFTFKMAYNESEGVNGYIKFTAYNSQNGKIYFDNVSIDRSDYMINDSYEQMPIGEFSTHESPIFNHYHTAENVKSEFVKVGNDTKAKMSFTLAQSTEGAEVFYINKLAFLNLNRDYDMSIDLETSNVDKIWIYQGGTWCEPNSYIIVDITNNSVSVQGSKITDVSYVNNKLSFKFNTAVDFNDSKQFQFVVQVKDANVESYIMLDNFVITQKPVVTEINIEHGDVKKRYIYGEELVLDGLTVEGIYSDSSSKKIELSDCVVTGYDKFKPGRQVITVTYGNVYKTFEVYVSRVIKELIVNSSEIKNTYNYGEKIDLSNLTVYASYIDEGDNLELDHKAALGGYAIDLGGYDEYTPGTYTITIYYLDAHVTFDVVVNGKTTVTFDDYSYVGTGK